MTRFFLLIVILFPFALSIRAQGFKIVNPLSSIKKDDGKTKIQIDSSISEDAYITVEILKYKYLSNEKKDLTCKKSKIEEKLKKDLEETSNIKLIEQVRRCYYDTIKSLINKIALIKNQQDSLYDLYTKDLLNYHNLNVAFGSKRSKAFFDMFYGNDGIRFKALGNSGINFGNKTGAIYSELVSGNLGIFRVGLGSMVSSTNSNDTINAKQDEAYQRLVTYGGNTVLTIEYPLAYFHSNNNQYNFLSRAIAKGTADLPAFGTKTDKWAGSCSIGIDFYGDAALNNNNLRFFFNFNYNKIFGTDIYKNNLGIDNSKFMFGQLSFGLIFMENYKISFIVTTFSSEKSLQNRNIIAGGQVLR